jgi:RNA polymerase sigma factor (sigma-70 family)
MALHKHRANERELLLGCLRGDPAAQHSLYQTFAPKMYTLCCRYLKDNMLAEDALVSAFTRILQRIHQFKGEGSLEGWIKTIVIREALAILRRNQHLRFQTDLDTVEAGSLSQPPADTLETAELMIMIGELPPGYRTVFNMYAIDGFSHKEIAEHLGISENTSKSQLSRARVLLQQRLAALESPLIKTRS